MIVAPTREIAVQICSVVSAIGEFCGEGLAVECFIGGLAIDRDRKRLRRCNVVVGTPGRVRALVEEGSLQARTARTLVLDEADKLLEETFMDDLEFIVQVLPRATLYNERVVVSYVTTGTLWAGAAVAKAGFGFLRHLHRSTACDPW